METKREIPSNEKIEIRGAKTHIELEEVVELCDRSFPDTQSEYFERHLLKDKTLKYDDTRILIKNGKIVSSVQVFPRWMHFKGETVAFGGIGNVATDPEYRKHGLASIMMNDALEYIKKGKYAFSMLTTTINPYYEKFGFQTIRRVIAKIKCPDIYSSEGIRKFIRQKDFSSVKELYRKYNCGSLGPVVRDEIYWESQLDFSGELKESFFVKEQNGKLQGYIRAGIEKKELHVFDYAASENIENNFRSLLAAVCKENSVTEIKMFLSDSEKIRISPPDDIETIPDTDLMVCFWNEEHTSVKDELIKDNNITYWLADFF